MWRSATVPPPKLGRCQSCATYLRRPHNATGSTGCTHEVAVKPSDEVPIRQKVVQTKVASEDRTSADDAADSSAVGGGVVEALLRAVPRQALDGNGVTQNTG